MKLSKKSYQRVEILFEMEIICNDRAKVSEIIFKLLFQMFTFSLNWVLLGCMCLKLLQKENVSAISRWTSEICFPFNTSGWFFNYMDRRNKFIYILRLHRLFPLFTKCHRCYYRSWFEYHWFLPISNIYQNEFHQ